MLQAKSQRLKELLIEERKKYRTDSEFAQQLKVKAGTLNRWLRSVPAVWPERHIKEIESYYGKSIDDLTTDRRGRKTRVREGGTLYSVTTFEELAPAMDRLDREELVKTITYAVNKLSAV